MVSTQIGSFGVLFNTHFCNGRQTSTCVYIANKGCDKDVKLIDRILFRVHDCHEPLTEDGVRKKPCCEFASVFEKISVYNESPSVFPVFISSIIDVNEINWLPSWTNASADVILLDRGPPDKGVCLLKLFCVFLI
jgi:hypothetical protein